MYHVIRFSEGSLQILLIYKLNATNSYYFKSLLWLDWSGDVFCFHYWRFEAGGNMFSDVPSGWPSYVH